MKPTLTIIQSTHASLAGLQQSGLLDRHKRLLAEYGKVFRVVQYSCDEADYSAQLEVEHRPVPWLPRAFGWRHLVFYLWLVWQAPRMKGVIKVFGSNIPTLPLVRLLSGRPMMVTFQFDYAGLAEEAYGGKGIGVLLNRWMERLALQAADLVLVTTPTLEAKARQVYHKPTVLSPNWVDIEQCRLASNDGRNPHLILYAGRLHKIKGVDVLIDAFARIKQHHPKASLVICGVGEEQKRLEAQVKSLGVDSVEFRGRVPNAEVLRLMGKAAVFVLPTLTMEGHPKALIEAMACGAACVVSDVPGNRDMIADEQIGILVPPCDVEALSRVLDRLLGDRSLQDRLGRNAQIKASDYSFSEIVSQEIRTLAALGGIGMGRNSG